MLTSQYGCQFSMFILLLCYSFCTPEGESSYPVWQTNDYEFTVDDFPPSTDNLVSIPLGGSGPRIIERHPYKSSNSESRLNLQEELEEDSNAPPSTLRQSAAPPSPLDVFIGELFHRHSLPSRQSANNQNSRGEDIPAAPFFKDEDELRDTRIDWTDVPFPSSITDREGAGNSRPEGGSGKFGSGKFGSPSDGMISSLATENLPLMSKRIMVKKRLPNRHAAIKRWWGNYYRPRPQMDRRAAQSKHYGCLKRCINAGKLHPIQCHTLC